LQICSFSFSGAGNGVIPANADLVFEMTLVALKKKVSIEITKNVTCTSDQKTRDKDTVEFNYIGKLVNGIFDKSFCVSSWNHPKLNPLNRNFTKFTFIKSSMKDNHSNIGGELSPLFKTITLLRNNENKN
jgi:hypothetical protein